ncbi:MAG: hypothetical protein SFW67_08315 [Myxococcaceae bacterium]|nr:hypothetical protein [Myxococcaceae bacterium]
MSRLTLALVLLAGCGTLPGLPDAGANVGKVWAVQAFVERHGVKAVNDAQGFGGFAPEDLVAAPGALLYLDATRREGERFGLNVLPGVSEGVPLGFIVTDVWENHPAPWVQPVYSPVTADRRIPIAPDQAFTIFPVGVASTFYSPWWEQRFFPIDPLTEADRFTSATDVLNSRRDVTSGALVFCPLVDLPDGGVVEVAGAVEPGGAVVTRHPLTGERLQRPTVASAWVDSALVKYLRLGPNRGRAEGQQLVEAPMYVFTLRGVPLATAAVLPAGAAALGFKRRVDVPLPMTAGVFVPQDRPEWRAALLKRQPDAGLDAALVTRPDAGPGEFHEYALRVVQNRACVAEPTFPASCTWLDSEARVMQLGTARETNVLLSVAVLGAQP